MFVTFQISPKEVAPNLAALERSATAANLPKLRAFSSAKIGIAPSVCKMPSPISPFEYALIAGTIELAPDAL